jgi:hypothetical protein
MYMRPVLVVFLILFSSVTEVFSQSHFKENNFYDATIAMGKNQGLIALSWAHVSRLGKKERRLGVGYGLRFTSYYGKNQNYITAPARLTSRQTGPQVIFSKTYAESLDTVSFTQSQINSLNIALYFDYKVTPRFEIGFNIDAVGFSFGGRQNGRLMSSLRPESLPEQQTAKPTSVNVLLVSDNDIGSLNSEFLARCRLTDHFAIKAGFCFLFAEYQTEQKLIFDNDRFRNKASMGFIGITYNPFKLLK